MKFYVIRHGLTPLNKEGIPNGETDEPLAPEGIQQALDFVPEVPPTVKHIYTTPLSRGVHTGTIIAEGSGLPLTILRDFSEVKMGSLAGTAWSDMEDGEEIKRLHRAVEYDYVPYGGENPDQVATRLGHGILYLESKHEDGEALVVTHGGVVRTMKHMAGLPLDYETVKNVSLLTFDSDQVLGRHTA